MKKFPVKAICRAGIIAALYAVLTIYLGSIAYGPFQIRPAEALTLLPLLYAESIPALFVGCLIANLVSPYGVPDIVVGSLITLVAACLTYIIPRFFKKPVIRAAIGGLFPVFLNAVILPVMWLIMGGMGSFWYNLLSMSCTGFEGEEHVVYHRLYDVANITVISNKNTVGVFDMESQVKTELTKAEARKE